MNWVVLTDTRPLPRNSYEDEKIFKGRSGSSHAFDFGIPQPGDRPPIVLHVLGKPDKIHVQSFTYEVIDTLEAIKGPPPEFFALYSDATTMPERFRKALHVHGIEPIQWSERAALQRRIA